MSYEEEIPLLARPPSRSLVSLVRRNLYHSLKLDLETLRKLIDCIGSSLELASYTKHLIITHKPMDGRKAAKMGGLLDFFKSATALKSLEIDDDNLLSTALFSPRLVIHSYPALESLIIANHQFDDDTSLVQRFRYLALIPRLRSLEMYVHCGRETEAEEPTLLETRELMNEQLVVEAQAGGEPPVLVGGTCADFDVAGHLDEIVLQSLTLAGDIGKESVVELMTTIRSISSLSLSSFKSYRVDINNLLSAVDPTNLTSLSIFSESTYISPLILDPAIGRFDQLESLRLPSDCHSPGLATAIAELSNLESISFVYPSTPDFAALASIFTLPELPPSLKSITIPVPYFCRGAFHLEADYEPTYDFDGRVVPDPVWEPPVWSNRFTLDQAERLIGLTGRAGVFLDSRLAEVIQASREYDEEERWCIDQPIAEWGSGQGLVFG